jgi:hypothetical protein
VTVYTVTSKKEDMMMATEPKAAAPAVKLFNGRYTIESKQTGEHRTFWVKTQAADAEFAPGKRVVSLLTGSQNDDPDCYTGFAFVDDRGIHVWASKAKPGAPAGSGGHRWLQFADLLWALALDGALSPWADKGFTILMEGACCRCNRPLTTPESIRNGIGPICAELAGGGF